MRYGATLGAIGLLSVAPTGILNAQDGGVVVEFDVSQTVRASDNPDLTDPAEGEIIGITSFAGSVSTTTRQRSFTLGFDTGLELGEDGFELGDTGVEASYVMRTDGSEFELFGRYRQRNVTTEIFEDLDGVGDLDLSVTTGTRVDYRYGARAEFGSNGPLTFNLGVQQRGVDFDTADPDAIDSETLSFSGSVLARVDPATRVGIEATYSETEDDDAANSRETRTTAGVSLTRDLGDATTVSAAVDWQEVESTGATDSSESGVGGRLSFDRDLPNGSFGATAERDYTVNGTIDEIRLDRDFELRDGSLGLDAGIVITEGDTVSPLLGISYERLAPDGRFDVSIRQGATVNGDNETVLNTVGRASYTREVNEVSSYRAAVSISNQDVIDDNDTTQRINGSLTYNRSLTEEVRLSTGYEHSRLYETGENERTSNTVFVTISRGFSARP